LEDRGFQLNLGKIEQLFSLDFKATMALRSNGSRIFARTTETGKLGTSHPFASIGSFFANLSFEENQKNGSALVYWDPTRKRVVIPSIKTTEPGNSSAPTNLPAGAGSIILTWLGALAAQEGADFEVYHIQNPQILRILARGILNPEKTVLEYCQNVDDEDSEGDEILETVHGLKGEFQYNQHPDATFTNVRGPAHPHLLDSIHPLSIS